VQVHVSDWLLVILPNLILELQHTPLPPKCYVPENVPQLLTFPLFSFQIHIWVCPGAWERVRGKPTFLGNFTFSPPWGSFHSLRRTILGNTPFPYQEVHSIPRGKHSPLNALKLPEGKSMHHGPANPSRWKACASIPWDFQHFSCFPRYSCFPRLTQGD